MQINNGIEKMLEEARELERVLTLTLTGIRGARPEPENKDVGVSSGSTMSLLEHLMNSLIRCQSMAMELGNFFTDLTPLGPQNELVHPSNNPYLAESTLKGRLYR